MEKKIDEANEDSFPASDPPSWTLGSSGEAAPAGAERRGTRPAGRKTGSPQRGAAPLSSEAIFWMATGALLAGVVVTPPLRAVAKLALRGGLLYLAYITAREVLGAGMAHEQAAA